VATTAERVWNRACGEAGEPKTLTTRGDRALADMVLAHSLIMNGGVLHAIECLTTEERIAAASGYRYFGLNSAADVLDDIANQQSGGDVDDGEIDLLEIEADGRYAAVVPDDGVLVTAFEVRFMRERGAFAEVD
jgi:hypothetical protein